MRGGHAILVESSKKVKPWRKAVAASFLASGAGKIRGPVVLDVTFTMVRPKSAKRGAVPAVSPDLSKLIRSTEDALTIAGAWEDDGRVVSIIAAKRYPNEGEDALPVPGAVIRVECA